MGSNLIPSNISLPIKLIDEKNILNMLSKERGSKVKLEYPQIGEKAKELRITMKNAELLLNDRILRKNKYKMFTPNSVTSLQSDLNLDVPPKNIEGFEGEGDLLSRFGVEIRDQITFTLAQKTWSSMTFGERETIKLMYRQVKDQVKANPNKIAVYSFDGASENMKVGAGNTNYAKCTFKGFSDKPDAEVEDTSNDDPIFDID